ncbi:MAG: type II secretion system F family protein [Phycisphaerales bacterium]|nr:type II secretion system F family protein [Phycisphaerales bacterium]
MATLSYKARSVHGQTLHGRIDAPSAREALRRLRRDGVRVVSIAEARGLRAMIATRAARFSAVRVRTRDILNMIAQLQLLIESGTGLDDGLKVLGEATVNPRLRTVIADVRERVKAGESLSAALSSHNDVFDTVVTSMIAAGEASGTLARMLGTIHDMLLRQDQLRRSIVTALAYPAILLSVAGVALLVLFVWVLPKFAQVFAEVGAELPQITQIVLAFSEFVKSHKYLLLIGGISTAIGLRWMLTIPAVRMAVHRGLLRTPLVGRLIRSANTARSTHVMGTLWRSGLPVMEVIRLTAGTIRNPIYRAFLETLRQDLVDGKRMTATFEASGLFPPTVAPLIRTGEETGNTTRVLEALASYHERETAGLIKTMITLLEPAIIVVMAAGVGLIAISVVVPLFRLSSAVH